MTMNGRTALAATTTLLALMALTAPVAAQNGYTKLDHDDELRLAMSAGPLSVSSAADVWVLGETGFERAIEGTNGFACLVVRTARNPEALAPHCLNPDAVGTVLPAMLREAELQMKGLGAEAIDEQMMALWDSGELAVPTGPAYAYMLSEGQQLGAAGNFEPHFMLYVPYATNADIGGDPQQMAFPFVGPYENHPLSTIVIIMEEFVSPDSVVLPRR